MIDILPFRDSPTGISPDVIQWHPVRPRLQSHRDRHGGSKDDVHDVNNGHYGGKDDAKDSELPPRNKVNKEPLRHVRYVAKEASFQRPEVVESLYYLWKATKDPVSVNMCEMCDLSMFGPGAVGGSTPSEGHQGPNKCEHVCELGDCIPGWEWKASKDPVRALMWMCDHIGLEPGALHLLEGQPRSSIGAYRKYRKLEHVKGHVTASSTPLPTCPSSPTCPFA